MHMVLLKVYQLPLKILKVFSHSNLILFMIATLLFEEDLSVLILIHNHSKLFPQPVFW